MFYLLSNASLSRSLKKNRNKLKKKHPRSSHARANNVSNVIFKRSKFRAREPANYHFTVKQKCITKKNQRFIVKFQNESFRRSTRAMLQIGEIFIRVFIKMERNFHETTYPLISCSGRSPVIRSAFQTSRAPSIIRKLVSAQRATTQLETRSVIHLPSGRIIISFLINYHCTLAIRRPGNLFRL